MKIVLQKFIASSGCCSRRQAEVLIREKKVLVNNKLAELGMKVNEKDEVKIGNKIIKPSLEKIYIKLNKPVGYTCTNRTFEGEKNVFELLDVDERGLFIVGRLDKNSRGLVIISNDGDWAEKVTHPRYEHEKEYLVRIKNLDLRFKNLEKYFRNGIDIGEGDGVVKVKLIESLGDSKFKIVLTQGKKRQIRRMFDAVGEKVIDLKRVRIGDIELGDLKEGEFKKFNLPSRQTGVNK